MEKIGVISLYGRFNYGNRLQNYATCRICEMEGMTAESLVLDKRFNLEREIKNKVKKLMGRPDPPPIEKSMNPLRLAAFDRFNTHIPIRHIHNIDNSLKNEYSHFIVGSDQVWNPRFYKYNEDWYFLRFADKSQRIALAASIGLNELTFQQKLSLSHGVKGFSNLSVRERRGSELISQQTNIDVRIVCDPTLVIPAEEWLKLSDDRLTPKSPYVFTYLLGGDLASRDLINKVSKYGQLPVIALTDRDCEGEFPAGPSEFISLIKNATHVVTDSFHAAVFSCIFQTPLTIFQREGGASMFSRLEQLSSSLGIEHKVYGSSDFDLSRAGDYSHVSEAIEDEKKNYLDFFLGCFEASHQIGHGDISG